MLAAISLTLRSSLSASRATWNLNCGNKFLFISFWHFLVWLQPARGTTFKLNRWLRFNQPPHPVDQESRHRPHWQLPLDSPHLRHPDARQDDNGVDIRFIQQLLGHEKLETTAIYTEVNINQLVLLLLLAPLFLDLKLGLL
ncbi:MAG: tyrosine-type recombinase/integrase [Verrucomicrobiales bacterium]